MELSTLDVKIKEVDKALFLLASLPVSYDCITTTLLLRKDTLKHEEVIVALLLNESRQKSCNDSLLGRVAPWLQLMVEVDQLRGKQVLVSTCSIPNPRITNHLYDGIVVRKANCPERGDSEEKR